MIIKNTPLNSVITALAVNLTNRSDSLGQMNIDQDYLLSWVAAKIANIYSLLDISCIERVTDTELFVRSIMQSKLLCLYTPNSFFWQGKNTHLGSVFIMKHP